MPTHIASTEQEIDFCVSLLMEVVTIAPLTPPLIAAIDRSGLLYAILSLLFAISDRAKASYLLKKVEELCFDYFDHFGSLLAARRVHDVIFGLMNNSWKPNNNTTIDKELITTKAKVIAYIC